jgi:hypothetical protein
MRILLSALLLISWIHGFGQASQPNEVKDCEIVTSQTIDRLSEDLKRQQLDSFDLIVNEWVRLCGITECTQRLIILKSIKDHQPIEAAIQLYLENNFHRELKYRIENAKRINFGYIYAHSKAYFDFVPLRHQIDSIIAEESSMLLKTNTLNPDEKLFCLMFTGDILAFDKEIKKSEYDKSFTKQLLLKNHREKSNQFIAYTLYTGMYRPLRPNSIFSNSPMIGLTFGSPLKHKLLVELGIKFRININDASFNYYALGDTNFVNSDLSVFFGGTIGYKLYESEKLILIPKIGIGLESVDTGLSEPVTNSQQGTELDIETLHLSLGLSALTPVSKRSYLGIGMNYHYCPYQWDKNLLTQFDNNLLSAEVFWRF